MNLQVRDLLPEDVPLLADYWSGLTEAQLQAMGADPAKMPPRETFVQMLSGQLALPVKERAAHPLLWLIDGKPSGHCNVNQIQAGKHAHMHLHLWESGNRQRGAGSELVRQSVPHFFRDLDLETLYCEPYAQNPAPNKTLRKVGFTFVKTYVTVPGSINFEQEVNLWELNRSDWEQR